MLTFAVKAGIPRRLLVLAACDLARLALPYAGEYETVARSTIEISERWCDGLATKESVIAAANAAYDACVGRTPHAIIMSAYSAYSVVYPYGAAHAYAEVDKTTRMQRAEQHADLVRARIPYEVIAAALEAV